jgi:hypothetical protein
MGKVVIKPFEIEPRPSGRWVVLADGATVEVQTLSEAELLAYLPLEHAKLQEEMGSKLNASRVRRLLAIARRHNYTSSASQQLAAWLAQHAGAGRTGRGNVTSPTVGK